MCHDRSRAAGRIWDRIRESHNPRNPCRVSHTAFERAILVVNMAAATTPMDYSVHYASRNDGETDAALVVRRGAHELSFTEAAAWTAVKGWLAPLGEAADDVPFGCVAQYLSPASDRATSNRIKPTIPNLAFLKPRETTKPGYR